MSNPWAKFFWTDWDTEPGLRISSLAAQGLWMRMLCIAATADPAGYVLIAERPVTAVNLAQVTGAAETSIVELLGELERNGVFSRDKRGRIYCRRMVKDEKIRRASVRSGKKGGNPALKVNIGKDERKPSTLKGGDKAADKAGVAAGGWPQKPETRSQRPEARDQKPETKDQRVPPERIARALSAAATPRTPIGAEEKRRRWAGKISNEICRRETPERAIAIIDAWQRGEKWAKDEFNRVDAILRENKNGSGG